MLRRLVRVGLGARIRAPAATGAIAAVVGVAGGLAPATASANVFEVFSNCPVETPEMELCVAAHSQYKTTHWKEPEGSSFFSAGKVTVPLSKKLTLQGGLHQLVPENEEESSSEELIRPTDGAPQLVRTEETVPGGLRATVNPARLSGAALEAYKTTLKNFETKVTATIEVAPENAPIFLDNRHLLAAEGTFLTLPVKVKFNNSFLGESCYAGSDASPILVELTDGTTAPPPPAEPIKGKLGELRGVAGGKVIEIIEDTLVANSFAAPGVEGCGREAAWHEEVDAAINEKVGLPSPAGTNTTVIHGTLFLAQPATVKEKLGI